MTLTTHAIVGAAAAALVPDYPVAAFALAFASHLAIDSLPHYDYELLSESANPEIPGFRMSRAFFLDLARTGFDACLGTALAWIIFHTQAHPFLPLIGAIGGVTPDFLQFMYKFFPRALGPLQRLHDRLQAGKTRFRYHPVPGLALQAMTLAGILTVYVVIAAIS